MGDLTGNGAPDVVVGEIGVANEQRGYQGRAPRIVEDLEERKRVLDTFNRCFRPGAEGISLDEVSRCCAVEITITEMAGRQERERKRTCWKTRMSTSGFE
ncbi:MAG TPA: hypothetical protein VM487_03020 [Phycisphaerae bacterium]|nr:hypothetical protein [Phycisphaerae bacterium]